MTVYKIFDCHNEYKIVSTTPSSVARQLGDIDLIEKIVVQPLENFSLKSIWGEVDIEFEDVLKKDSLLPDISLWLRVFLVLSPKAYASLKEPLSKVGEFLSIRYKGEEWYLYTPLEFGQEDEDKCVQKIEYGSLAGVEVLVFNESDIAEKVVFKSKMLGASFLYCTEPFKSLCEQNELGGVVFSSNLTDPFS
ncbi:hypothetical protein C4G74_RS11540 [Vibrio parahaemolyticus]|nr:hypothetical protein [Vibrio parahaemolyticus]EHH1045196.1 hypothetical protein [Vibrio parahaemolyticus]EHK2867394.1 hypothetical protein [Vibrio parahaemolyticus]EHZ2490341.1 hypothetical protein [Vibrio parahaemolyticus]EJG0672829.1 hypothetical protein [Vibrio parahaemolyticus]